MTSTNPSAILEIILALFELALYLVPIGVAALIAWNVYPKRFEVTRVVDGDSLEVRRGNRQLRVRIKHFDAPEYHQDGGREARIYLAQLLKGRSEEHTSELQSLMRISYAVFCLKKKNNIKSR